jgi:hypothetical protein
LLELDTGASSLVVFEKEMDRDIIGGDGAFDTSRELGQPNNN